MGKLFIIIICNFIIASSAFSQSQFYIPRNFQEAYENGTRSADGKPGSNYWQNRSDYRISAQVDPSQRKLTGQEHIQYYNNSPDTLKQIVIRLYQDMNKSTGPHSSEMRKESITEGVDVQSVSIEGNAIDLSNEDKADRMGTNLYLRKINPVLPGKSVSLDIDWSFIIPKSPNPRMGAYDSTSYMVAYWYPQVSVYDDIDGWDRLNYAGNVEFYNDFSDYDVDITVPNNMCTWATGILQNPEEILSPPLLERYNSALTSDSVVNIITPQSYLQRMSLFNASGMTNTWHYKAENVTEFAFACSDKYLWDAVSVEVEPGRRVLTGAAYNPESKDFYQVAAIARDVIRSFSKDFPGVPYPYPRETVFNGAGGMEFPMMVNDGSTSSRRGTVNVTSHEIAHTYFPFYMGINEEKYAWMDEGWAQYLPVEIQKSLADSNDQRARNLIRYADFAGSDRDLPMMIPSYEMVGVAYGNASYFRPEVAYDILRDMLGKEMFDRCLHEYMARWNGKHPVPYDFFYTFEDVSGRQMDWFWQPWFFESGYPDLSIDSVVVSSSKIKVLISMEGKLPIPVSLTFKAADGSENNIYRTAEIWKDGNDDIWLEQNTEGKKIKSIELGSPYIPDVDKENNVYTVK